MLSKVVVACRFYCLTAGLLGFLAAAQERRCLTSVCEDAFKSHRCLQVLLPDSWPAGFPGCRSGEALSHICGKYRNTVSLTLTLVAIHVASLLGKILKLSL
jgi:hypothetical protein